MGIPGWDIGESVKFILLLILIVTTCQAQPIILELSNQINGTGLVDMSGPGEFEQRAVGVQNISMNFSLNESAFEQKL